MQDRTLLAPQLARSLGVMKRLISRRTARLVADGWVSLGPGLRRWSLRSPDAGKREDRQGKAAAEGHDGSIARSRCGPRRSDNRAVAFSCVPFEDCDLDGPSVRTLHLKRDEVMKEESDQDDEVARISGNKWREFSGTHIHKGWRSAHRHDTG